jgi:hypothetical protein
VTTTESEALRLPVHFGWVSAATFLGGEGWANPKLEGPVRTGSYATAVYTSDAVGPSAPATPSLELDRVVGNRILIFP